MLERGPVQQPVGLERVVDPAASLGRKLDADRRAALAQGGARSGLLLGRRAVFLRQMLGQVLAAFGQVGVEFERLQVQADRHGRRQALERLQQRGQPDGAPGAGDIGDEIDVQQLAHG